MSAENSNLRSLCSDKNRENERMLDVLNSHKSACDEEAEKRRRDESELERVYALLQDLEIVQIEN